MLELTRGLNEADEVVEREGAYRYTDIAMTMGTMSQMKDGNDDGLVFVSFLTSGGSADSGGEEDRAAPLSFFVESFFGSAFDAIFDTMFGEEER